jgi:hypothetical protein
VLQGGTGHTQLVRSARHSLEVGRRSIRGPRDRIELVGLAVPEKLKNQISQAMTIRGNDNNGNQSQTSKDARESGATNAEQKMTNHGDGNTGVQIQTISAPADGEKPTIPVAKVNSSGNAIVQEKIE